MKVIHLSYFDAHGGSGRASYRIHHALLNAEIESRMMVKDSVTSDWTVQVLAQKRYNRAQRWYANQINKRISQFKTTNPVLHSPDVFSSVDLNQIRQSDADIINLHWFNSGMLSITDIGKIKKPLVWTLYDMWGFCGAEHYTEQFRWKEGYQNHNRPSYESGFDLNRWVWNRKRNHWKRPIHIVAPSQWLAECVQQSVLMREWTVTIIPYPINTNLWQPLNKNLARQILKLPEDVPLLIFGAIGGGNDLRKGFDLLKNTLKQLQNEIDDLELVVFGQLAPASIPDLGFPVHYTGHLYDDISLQLYYSAANLMIVPSRQEAFGQTASEAHACGTPVVAFNVGGLPDIVEHYNTGYLAKPYDITDLAQGIKWVLNNNQDGKLGIQARRKAVEKFSQDVIADQYISVYKQVLNNY